MNFKRSILQWFLATSVLMIAAVGFSAHAQDNEQLSSKQQAAIEALVDAFQIGDGNIETLLTLRQTFDGIINGAVIQALSTDDALPEWGNADGPLVVEFSDYQCGYCKRMFPTLQNSNVRVRMIEYPILGELSVQATRYALAAQQQNRYAEFHTLLMQEGRLSEDVIKEAAITAGLDMEKLEADINSEEIDAKIRANYAVGRALNVRGTPFMVIGGNTYGGSMTEERLQEILNN